VKGHWTIKGSERRPLPGARSTGPANARASVVVSIKVRRKKELPDLRARPARTMTRRALAWKFGASARDIAKVVTVFERFGLNKLNANAGTRAIQLRGTVAQMESAFHTKLYDYAYEGGHYLGRVGPVRVPSELKNIVVAVFGLDSRRVARRRRQPARLMSNATTNAMLEAWYTPGRLAEHYSFPEGDGGGQALALLEFGGGYFARDLRKFCALAGVAVPKVRAISVDGTSTSKRDDDAAEVMLDVEIMAGVCPKSKIAIYFAQWTERGWIEALDAVMQDSNEPSVVSVSWGNAEDTDIWTSQAIAQINESLKEAAYRGMTICVAAGDDGSSDGVMDGLAHVDFPGSSPYVLSVGGTTIPSPTNAGPDVVWKEGSGLRAHNGGSTGGGVSSLLRRPEWQKSVAIKSVNRRSIAGRCVPDVAANADWSVSPYLLVVEGRPQPNGGTSAASPLLAALIARMNATRGRRGPIGYLTPVLYQKSGRGTGKTIGALGCTDVISGNNGTEKIGGYSAGPGYDAVSGWGTPNGKNLLSALPF